MSPEDAPPPRDRLFFPAALILLLVAGGYALWRALVGVGLLTTEELAVPVVLTIAIAAGALLGWWRDRRRATVLLEAHRRARGLAESEAQARAVALEEVDARLREESAARQAANDVTRAAEEQLRQRHAELRRQTTELEEAARQKEEADRRHADQSEQQAATVAGLEGKLRTETDAHAAERTARERAETELSARGNDLEESRSELETARAEVAEEQARRRRMEDARRSEIEWISRLRQEVLEREAMRGVLGDPADMPSLVLRMAMSLLEADKGLLLSRTDEDADGSLDLAASEGFEHDPSDSALAQRFAHQVIEVDRIIRHDDPEEVAAAHRTPADDEIETLVAIPIYLLDKFSGVVICANRPGGFAGCDNQVLIALGNQAGAVLQNARLRGDLRTAYLSTVRVLADAMEAKDGSLRGHGNEVASYSAAVADRMGLEPKRREEVVFGSLLHDVGKIGISE
nr:hypothetical protein [Chloroflexota bacterium]